MLDKESYKSTRRTLAQLSLQGRYGPVNTTNQQILCFTLAGNSVLIDCNDFSNLKLSYLPLPIHLATYSLLYHLINPGMHCIDLGAGCGYHAISLAHLVGSNGLVYAFEANSHFHSFLKSNVELNGYINQNKPRVVCEATTPHLDHYFKNSDIHFNFIHISESIDALDAFYGMFELLQRCDSIFMLCKLFPSEIEQKQEGYELLFEKLTELRFGGYLLPELILLESKRQLLQDPQPKTILLSRQPLF